MVQKNTRDRLRLVEAAGAGMVPPPLQDDLTQHSDAELIGYADGVLMGLEAGLAPRAEAVARARAALTELACRSLRTFGVEREVEALRSENNDLRAEAASWRLIAQCSGDTFGNIPALVDDAIDAFAQRLQPLRDVAEQQASRIQEARALTPPVSLRRPDARPRVLTATDPAPAEGHGAAPPPVALRRPEASREGGA
ncbi:MAG: hypothetical protein WC273_12710 [Dehalococcoidia bacterium]